MGSDTILSSPSVPGGHILVRVIAPPAGWQDGAPTVTLEHYQGANGSAKEQTLESTCQVHGLLSLVPTSSSPSSKLQSSPGATSNHQYVVTTFHYS